MENVGIIMSKVDYHIFLIGFMGAGKSTVASELAARLKCSVVEMDARIVKEQGMSINEIFEQFGEDHFRDIESRLIVTLGTEKAAVISCGGGVILRPENVEHMKKSGKIVYLTATPETIFHRVKNSTERPILNGNMNVEYIAQLMEKRREKYQAAADLAVATDEKSKHAICEEILSRLEEME